MTNGQLVLLIVQRFNCTPLQAKNELLNNKDIFELLELSSYEEAYGTVKRWENMTAKQKKGLKEPKGKLISLVRKNKKAILKEEFEEHDTQLENEGRA